MSLNILSYNVHGLENKVLYNEFFQYIKTCDIFILIETHILEVKIERFKKFFNGYDTFWKPATRISNYGRGIGGYVYGVKKDLKRKNINCQFKTENDINYIILKTLNKTINIMPLYLRAASWKEDYDTVYNFLINEDVENLIIIGDLNIRIGTLQQPLDDFIKSSFKAGFDLRNSKDHEKNAKGKMFLDLCEDFGLYILNGCTIGDEMGNFTFMSGRGESVIDICAVAHDNLEAIERFTVENKIWSDHMPIMLTMNVKISNIVKPMKLLPKLKWDERKKDEYRERLDQNLTSYKQQGNILQLKELTDIVHLSNPNCYENGFQFKKENKWFNFKCFNSREKSFSALQLHRQNPTETNKEEYLLENNKFKLVCEKSKFEYSESIANKINEVKTSEEWWNLIREIKNKELQPNPGIEIHVFRQYFADLLNPSQNANDIIYVPMFYSDEDLDNPIDIMEVKNVLAKAKCNKAPGEDRVSYEFFKNASDTFLQELTHSYNLIFESSILDEKFTTSIIFPIYKKGDKDMASNYRGISFMNTVAKIFMGIINKRINVWLKKHNILTEYQAGFREGYSTVDNLYNLAAIAHLKYKEKKKLYAFFVDFKAAFDKVCRKSLIYKLHSIGMSTKMVKMIESIYSHTKFAVWSGEYLSDEFDTSSGVKQGCLLSPTLFSIYLNDLHSYLEGGINIGSTNIRLLMYADDIVILADDVSIMQNMIHKLEAYCQMWNLEINLNKSEIMIFRNGGKISTREAWLFKGEPIAVCNEYTYLGVTLSPKMSFKKHVQNRNISAKNSINAAWKDFFTKKGICLDAKWNLFKAVCRAIQSYGAQMWGFHLFDEVDKLQRYFLKKILKLPSFTPTYVVMLETGIENNHIYTLDLHLRYIIKTLFEYNENRLPNQLTKLMIEKEAYWYRYIEKLSLDFNTIRISECTTKEDWELLRSNITNGLKSREREINEEKATRTTRFYSKLNFKTPQTYFEITGNINAISYIFKARGDLIELNGTRFQLQRPRICSLCNLNDTEDILHFIAKCPILLELRFKYFKKAFLTENDLICLLNNAKTYFKQIYHFITDAIGYRKELISEFNY